MITRTLYRHIHIFHNNLCALMQNVILYSVTDFVHVIIFFFYTNLMLFFLHLDISSNKLLDL